MSLDTFCHLFAHIYRQRKWNAKTRENKFAVTIFFVNFIVTEFKYPIFRT